MKHHTLIIVPNARAKFRKLRFSTAQAVAVLGTLLLLTAGSVVATFAFLQSDFDHKALARIEAENRELREVNSGFEESLQNLESQLTDYQDRIHKLAIVAGLAELSPVADGGIGGAEPAAPGGDDRVATLARFETELDGLGQGMNLLQQHFEDQRLELSATPAIAPVKGILTSGFGFRSDPFTGGRAFHKGLDFVAPPGKEVRATGDALVVRAERMRDLGNGVYLSHGYGITTRYGHLSAIEVKEGQRVRRGDIIGRVGNTGRSTGYHLHYEVRVDGKPTNPLGYILDVQ